MIVFFIVSSFTVEYLAQKYLIKFKLQSGMTFFEFVTVCYSLLQGVTGETGETSETGETDETAVTLVTLYRVV